MINRQRKKWTAAELDTVRDLYATTTAGELGRMLGRTPQAIRLAARKYGAFSGDRCGAHDRIWTVAEQRTLRRMWDAGRPVPEICSQLERSNHSIHTARLRLGLRPRARAMSPAEEQAIRDLMSLGASHSQAALRLADMGFPPRSGRVVGIAAKRLGASNGRKRGNHSGREWGWSGMVGSEAAARKLRA